VAVAEWPELPVQPNVIGAQSRSLSSLLHSDSENRHNGRRCLQAYLGECDYLITDAGKMLLKPQTPAVIVGPLSTNICLNARLNAGEKKAYYWSSVLSQWFDVIFNRLEHPIPASEALDTVETINPRLRSLKWHTTLFK
jgi:hypothetical protein